MNVLLKISRLFVVVTSLTLLYGCATIKLGPSYDKPFTEQVLEEGDVSNKVLVINLEGLISNRAKPGLLSKAPSVLDLVLMQLKRAEKDENIKAVLLKINSPGGGVTTSDILYHELLAFKDRTDKKVVVQMMAVAASGGVYVAMAADHVQAHPSTITGSVGVIAISADLSQTMEKIGVKVNVYKTGDNKDMGLPFRAASQSDQKAFQGLVDEMALNFYEVVKTQRNFSDEQLSPLKTAGVLSGQQALILGLVDSLGYVSDALELACEKVEKTNCQVVSYRFQKNPNVTSYSPSMQSAGGVNLLSIPLLDKMNLKSGLYYLYLE